MPRQLASSLRTPLRAAFPNNPQDGQEIRFLIDAANGIEWQFRYRETSSSARKWECIGGGYLYASNPQPSIDSSNVWISPSSWPAIAQPLTDVFGEYMVECGARLVAQGVGGAISIAPFLIGAGGITILATCVADLQSVSQVMLASVMARARTSLKPTDWPIRLGYYTTDVSKVSVSSAWLSISPVRIGSS